MERDSGGSGGLGAAAGELAEGQIGRARIISEEDLPGEAAMPRAEESGWSPQALALGAVALLIIIGTLTLILWGSFQL